MEVKFLRLLFHIKCSLILLLGKIAAEIQLVAKQLEIQLVRIQSIRHVKTIKKCSLEDAAIHIWSEAAIVSDITYLFGSS